MATGDRATVSRAFLSYRRTDSDFACALSVALNDGGVATWLDIDDLRPGALWRERIEREIVGSRAVILEITPEWLDSVECENELIVAQKFGKRIVPVMLRDTSMPQELSGLQFITVLDRTA